MIISRTPFRVSFFGGGTDLPEFYHVDPGEVLTATINKYMYITVNQRFDHTIRVSYSRTEIASTLHDIEHPIVREALRFVGIQEGLEITSIADIPAGTGLGSSSSFTVGLLHALYAYLGRHMVAEELARQACEIEINRLQTPIGKQDQYAAAFGGLQQIRFNPDETVFVDPLICPPDVIRKLNDHLLLFYMGSSREAQRILATQKQVTRDKHDLLGRLRALCKKAQEVLLYEKDLCLFGDLLHQGWLLKRSLAPGISSDMIDTWYDRALKAGAVGGKVLGAGGGGFFLFYAEPRHHDSVRLALHDLKPLPFQFEPQGSKIIYVGG